MQSQGTSKRRAIIVLGAERSGTSVVAEMLRRWGAFAGDDDQIRKGDQHQAQGYMEYTPLWDFLAKLGDLAQGVNWWDASFKERVQSKLRIRQYRDEALELISGMERDEKHR